jgi:hypothetical protein
MNTSATPREVENKKKIHCYTFGNSFAEKIGEKMTQKTAILIPKTYIGS